MKQELEPEQPSGQTENNSAGPNQSPGPEMLAYSLTLKDGIVTFLGLIVLWFLSGLALRKLKPFVDERSLTYLSGFAVQALLALVLMLLSWLKGFRLRDLGYRPVNLSKTLVSVLKAYGLVWIFMIVYSALLGLSGYKPPEQTPYTFLFAQKGFFILLNFLLAVVLAPIFEETMFRGVIYGSLRSKLGVYPAALVSAAIFSGMHFELYGFLPRFFLGILLALLFEKHKSLFASMALHATHNGVIFLLAVITLAG